MKKNLPPKSFGSPTSSSPSFCRIYMAGNQHYFRQNSVQEVFYSSNMTALNTVWRCTTRMSSVWPPTSLAYSLKKICHFRPMYSRSTCVNVQTKRVSVNSLGKLLSGCFSSQTRFSFFAQLLSDKIFRKQQKIKCGFSPTFNRFKIWICPFVSDFLDEIPLFPSTF